MPARKVSPFGQRLRYWRTARKRSQLDVALDADVSARHISFMETGRSQPSRDMVLVLAEVLDVPLRERNTLLQAAGYAPVYRERGLDAPDLAPVRRSLEFMLAHHDPYPAILVNRQWNLLMHNRAAMALLSRFIASPAALTPPVNVMRLLFQPDGMRPFVVNWDELASAMIQRLHREASATNDEDAHALVADLLAADGVPAQWRVPDHGAEHPVIVAMHVRRDDIDLRLFSALTTLGTALDITLHEIRIETFFPADASSDAILRELADP